MITLWHQGKFYDGFHNTLNNEYFMETTMINLGFDPLECEWIEYESNPHGHNPIKIEDSDKSVEWIKDEFVPTAIVTNADEIPEISRKYYSAQVFKMLSRIISKQNETLEKYLLPSQSAPEIPVELIVQTVVEDKIIMNPMKKMIPQESDFIFRSGRRLKRYSSESDDITLPKFDSLKAVADYLLKKRGVWNNDFLIKLKTIMNKP